MTVTAHRGAQRRTEAQSDHVRLRKLPLARHGQRDKVGEEHAVPSLQLRTVGRAVAHWTTEARLRTKNLRMAAVRQKPSGTPAASSMASSSSLSADSAP
mgnify:CR=1 FL=1